MDSKQQKLTEDSSSKTVAHELAKKQRDISVAEFFEKNRHLLGFDNKRKALLTAIKEAVDNSLDACEEAKVLPEINVEIIDMQNDRFKIVIEDNGPGIVKEQIPNIFAKLLYGSKFHTLKQQRGQQGIGISAAALYGQLTTGKPIKIKTKIGQKYKAIQMELHLDTRANQPKIVSQTEVDWNDKDHGTKIELDLEGSYLKGAQSVDEYIKETAIVNPHATIIYTNPKAEQFVFARVSDKLPKLPVAIKPHPYGIELGMLIKMLNNTECKTLQQFLTTEFSRVSTNVSKEITDKALIAPNTKPKDIERHHAEKLFQAIQTTKIMSPPTDCIFPIGKELLEKGLRKEIPAEYYVSITRTPSVYRGNPFVVEVAMAYGGSLAADQPAMVMRFANRVPLLYQPGACATNKAITQTAWRGYGFQQSNGQLPQGPLVILVHLASVWAPFTSEAKEALAHYPEIIKEMKLALQEAGRLLGRYVKKKQKAKFAQEKVDTFVAFIPEVADCLADLTGVNKEIIRQQLDVQLGKNREYIERVEAMKETHDDDDDKLGLEIGEADEDDEE